MSLSTLISKSLAAVIEPEGFDIRYSHEGDLSVLQSWFIDPQERSPFPFRGEQETELSLKNWIGFSRVHASLTGTLDGVPCAVGTLFLMFYHKTKHLSSFYLIVDAAHRKKGIGTSMVRNLIHLAKTHFRLEGIYAELFEPSPLRTILEKQHFQLFARQENFTNEEGRRHARLLMGQFFHE